MFHRIDRAHLAWQQYRDGPKETAVAPEQTGETAVEKAERYRRECLPAGSTPA